MLVRHAHHLARSTPPEVAFLREVAGIVEAEKLRLHAARAFGGTVAVLMQALEAAMGRLRGDVELALDLKNYTRVMSTV